jgi:hypothetical protein
MIGTLRDVVRRLQDGGLHLQNIVPKKVSLKPLR